MFDTPTKLLKDIFPTDSLKISLNWYTEYLNEDLGKECLVWSIQFLGGGHNSVYHLTFQRDICGSRLIVILWGRSGIFPKQRLHTLFEATTIFLTKYRVYAAIYLSAVAVAKQETRHLKPIRDATSLEYVAKICQQHIQVHQEPAKCKGQDHSQRHLQHVFLGLLWHSIVCRGCVSWCAPAPDFGSDYWV